MTQLQTECIHWVNRCVKRACRKKCIWNNWCGKNCTSGTCSLISKQPFTASIVTQVWEDWNGKRGGQLLQSWSHCALLLLSPSLLCYQGLAPTSLVFLFLHVFARHPLSSLRQSLTPRTVFTCPEAAAMVTRVTLWKEINITKTRVSYVNRSKDFISRVTLTEEDDTESSSHPLNQTMQQC